MSVSSTTTKNSHSGNGSTTAFAYSFKIFADADLLVIIRASTGAETTKSLSTHYTVSGAGAESGGTVTFTSGNTPASGETVVIRRNLGLTQATDYVENDPFPAESHEDALDRLTFITQGIQEELDRSFKVSKTNSITTPEFVDDASTRASKLLGFSSDGNNLEATTGRVSSVTTSNVAVDGSGASQSATVSFNSTSGALALGIPVGSTGAQGPAGDLNDPTTTQHDIIVRGASAVERLAKGANSTVLNTNASGALAYSTVSTAMIADDAVTYGKMQHTSTANRVLGAASAGTLGEVQVATDMIADDAVTLAKMASGTDGNLITYDSSGNPAHVATGSSGQVLTSNGAGAAPTFQAAGGGGYAWVEDVTFSGSTSGDPFSHTIETGYNYAILFLNCNSGADLAISSIGVVELGSGGGPTWIQSGYKNQTVHADDTSITGDEDYLTDGVQMMSVKQAQIGGDTDDEIFNGWIEFINPGAATVTDWTGWMRTDSNAPGDSELAYLSGRYETATAITAIRLNWTVVGVESGKMSLFRMALS